LERLVRWYLKTGITYLIVGLVLSGVMIVRREILGAHPSPYWVSAHTHVLLVGFVLMMILGVALWMFPRPERGDTHFRPGVAEAAYWLVSVLTGVRLIAELMPAATADQWLRWSVAAAGLGQILGLCLFFYNLWPRIRTAGARVEGK
jgi:heme/copper-type cytochrome/quinol oxidase subunit 1